MRHGSRGWSQSPHRGGWTSSPSLIGGGRVGPGGRRLLLLGLDEEEVPRPRRSRRAAARCQRASNSSSWLPPRGTPVRVIVIENPSTKGRVRSETLSACIPDFPATPRVLLTSSLPCADETTQSLLQSEGSATSLQPKHPKIAPGGAENRLHGSTIPATRSDRKGEPNVGPLEGGGTHADNKGGAGGRGVRPKLLPGVGGRRDPRGTAGPRHRRTPGSHLGLPSRIPSNRHGTVISL